MTMLSNTSEFSPFAAAARLAGGTLVSRDAFDSFGRLPRVLDQSSSWAMLECRLAEDSRVDAIFQVDRATRDEVLAICPMQWPTPTRVLSAWSNEQSALHRVPLLTIEVDHRGDWSSPIVFAALEPRPGEQPPGTVNAVMASLLAESGAVWPEALTRVLEQLPAQAWPVHIAALNPRGRPGARLVVSIPPNLVEAYLGRIGWEGDIPAVGNVAMRTGAFLPRMSIHLDVAESVGPEVGIELFYPGSPATDARWAPTRSLIEALSPTKVRALDHWPCRRGPLIRLLGIKLVLSARAAMTAKAYLAFCKGPFGE